MTTNADNHVANDFRNRGWKVLTAGWPDLLVWEGAKRRVMGIELKRGNDKPRPEQVSMQQVFSEILGVPYYFVGDDDLLDFVSRPLEKAEEVERSLEQLQEMVDFLARRVVELETFIATGVAKKYPGIQEKSPKVLVRASTRG